MEKFSKQGDRQKSVCSIVLDLDPALKMREYQKGVIRARIFKKLE